SGCAGPKAGVTSETPQSTLWDWPGEASEWPRSPAQERSHVADRPPSPAPPPALAAIPAVRACRAAGGRLDRLLVLRRRAGRGGDCRVACARTTGRAPAAVRLAGDRRLSLPYRGALRRRQFRAQGLARARAQAALGAGRGPGLRSEPADQRIQ